MKRKLKWIIPLAVLVLIAAVILIYAADYYHASGEAEAALVSDDLVHVEKTDFGWFFDGPSAQEALIFYPGGKVEETAYAPLLHRLAENGVDVFLLKVPMNLAILGIDRADTVMKQYSYDQWNVGGHSLGGVCATAYASKHPDAFQSVILLAAYPMKQLDDSVDVLFLYGSEDGVLNLEKYEEAKKYAPGASVEYVIHGGNHAQFGSYGIQEGDGTALISSKEQQAIALDQILSVISPAEAVPAS